ncbi:hypothetical protein [Psychroserpens sp.]
MFNHRKNKRFSYKSRIKGSEKVESKEDLEVKWNEMRDRSKRKGNILTSLPALIIILVSIFGLIYILNRYM